MALLKDAAETQLLRQYLAQVGGLIYGEVPIGKIPNRHFWSEKCTVRRIDGVRIPLDIKSEEILHFQTHQTQFLEQIRNCVPELIEVKRSLNRLVLGQALAAEDLFPVQYGVPKVQIVIICRKTDSAMEWVCQKRNIKVVQLD